MLIRHYSANCQGRGYNIICCRANGEYVCVFPVIQSETGRSRGLKMFSWKKRKLLYYTIITDGLPWYPMVTGTIKTSNLPFYPRSKWSTMVPHSTLCSPGRIKTSICHSKSLILYHKWGQGNHI